jgi:MFS family permease
MALKVLEKDGFYGYVNLGVLFIYNIASMLSMTTFTMFLPFWVKEFAWDRGELSFANSISLVISGLAAPFAGMLVMKLGAKRNIIIGNLIMTAGVIILSFMSEMWHLYVFYGVFIGIGFTIGGMLSMTTIINNWFVVKRTMALSIAMASSGLGGIFIAPKMMELTTTMGWRFTYQVTAAAMFICCVLIPGLFLKNSPEDLGQIPDGHASDKKMDIRPETSTSSNIYRTPVEFTAKEAIRTPALWFIVGYTTFQMLGLQALMTHQVAYLFDIGITPKMAALAGAIMSASMTVCQVGIGFLGLKFNIRSLAIASVVIVISGYILLIYARSVELVIVYSIIMGAGFGIQMLTMGTLIPNYFGMKEFPKIMGYAMPIGIILGGIGAPGAGYIREMTGSYIPAFQIALAIAVIAFICIICAKPPVHPSLRGQKSGETKI